MAKFYGVKSGKIIGVYNTWDDCKEQVNGYNGAQYKSFKTYDEAYLYVTGMVNIKPKSKAKIEQSPQEIPDGCVAYVDGSYDVQNHHYSYGVVILNNGEEKRFYKKFDNPDMADMRNVAGEIKGSEFAMRYCIREEIKQVTIFYDYQGVSKWCLGEWKTNKDGTRAYKEFYDQIKNLLDVKFVKVKSHSGDKYNDIADALAKKALGIKNILD